jgi:hypothetical protein
MVVNDLIEGLYNPPKPLGIVIPKYTRKRDNHTIIFTKNKAINIFKALRKAINKFKAIMNLKQGIFMDPMPYGIT